MRARARACRPRIVQNLKERCRAGAGPRHRAAPAVDERCRGSGGLRAARRAPGGWSDAPGRCGPYSQTASRNPCKLVCERRGGGGGVARGTGRVSSIVPERATGGPVEREGRGGYVTPGRPGGCLGGGATGGRKTGRRRAPALAPGRVDALRRREGRADARGETAE